MKKWDYALHSQTVKMYGGPEKYVKTIIANECQKACKAQNKKWARGVVPAALILIPFALKGAYDTMQEIKGRKVIAAEENEPVGDRSDIFESEENLC